MNIPFFLKTLSHKPFLFLSFLFISVASFAQIFTEKHYPVDYFIYPVKNVRISLSANFGELRKNHFHMGLDCRTDQAVNKHVVAAADGYVARVSVASFGFGQAIYINHPNGLTTVYGHLNKFFPKLAAYVRQKQYEQESWAISLNPSPDMFPLKQGQFIALSGSTGGSLGPHVHFEIRQTETDKVLNPLLFNLPIPDKVPPTLVHMYMYDRCRSTYAQKPTHVFIKKVADGRYVATNGIVPVHTDKISFAITANDKQSGSNNPNGIYQAAIYVDGRPMSAFQIDSITYDDTRYLNAHIDYKTRAEGGPYLQHLSRLPGYPEYPEGIYKDLGSDGVIELKDREIHPVKIVVKDPKGNTSTIEFKIQKGIIQETGQPDSLFYDKREFHPGFVNVFEEEGMQIYLDPKALYDSLTFSSSKKETTAPDVYSPLYSILTGDIPSHDYFTVRLKTNKPVNKETEDRMLMKRTWKGRSDVVRAEKEGAWYTAKFRDFGNFSLVADHEPPKITGSFANGANLSGRRSIVFTPKDNQGVIRNFRVELDGKWLMFSNDKGRNFIYYFDEKCPKGKHTLRVSVEDLAGNMTEKILTFTR